jgi:hypothetical protein
MPSVFLFMRPQKAAANRFGATGPEKTDQYEMGGDTVNWAVEWLYEFVIPCMNLGSLVHR